MPNCPKCSIELLQQAKFCPECGIKIELPNSVLNQLLPEAIDSGIEKPWVLTTKEGFIKRNFKSGFVFSLIGVLIILIFVSNTPAGKIFLGSGGTDNSAVDNTKSSSEASSSKPTQSDSESNNGLCGFGIVDPDYGDACLTPAGFDFQIVGGDKFNEFTYAGGGVYVVQFIVKNSNNLPASLTVNTQLKTSDGSTYAAMSPDDPFNPGGVQRDIDNVSPSSHSSLSIQGRHCI